MRTNAPTFGYLLSNEWDGELPASGIGKCHLWTMAATLPALIVQIVKIVESGNSHEPRANTVRRVGNVHMNHPRPNESTRDVDIPMPRAVRVFRTIHAGLSRSAKAWKPVTDTSRTKSKESSIRIGAFAINHPILAMLVLGLIALIGFVCIFELPDGWLPF